MRYFEAFGEGGYHSAFMTTYAFGALAFEDIPFPKLRGAGCRNIVVLADRAMVNQAFADFGPPRFAGTSYHLVKTDAPGAFHPKITMLIGENKGRLIVGSANLTALGLGGNKEQVASIAYSPESPESAKPFVDAISYLRRYVPADDEWFSVSLQRALRSAPWLHDAHFDPGFSGSGTEELNLLFDRAEITLLDQIISSIGNDPIERLIVVSPYWDSKLEGLARLRTRLGNPTTDLLIEADTNGFPSSELVRFSGISLFDIGASASGRFLHAKLIIAQGANWDHVISGSMNCTFPALMGPSSNGNAEAAIYKRVPRGSALEALELEEYADTPLHGEQLVQLQESFDQPSVDEVTIDGGTLTLQSDRLTWVAPSKLPSKPLHLQLYDRDGLALEQIDTNGGSAATHHVLPDAPRPKHGVLTLADNSVSAPIQVVDIDYLAVTTLPAQRGRKKRLMDALAESSQEDLSLVEMLTELEALEDEDRASRAGEPPKGRPTPQSDVARDYQVLSYEEFIRARTLANAQGKSYGLYLTSRHDRAANLVSACLNQMIGIVGPDLEGVEERDLESLASVDFRTTEPSSEENDQSGRPDKPDSQQKRPSTAQTLATAQKFREAVTAFEARTKALADKSITTSEMVRLRALMQIILSHAQPITGTHSASQILPIYDPKGFDWPRLIGRLLLQHFGAVRALQNLSVEQDESEQHRVLEYLAFSNWAAKAAYAAVFAEPKAKTLRVPLERLIASLTTQTQTILTLVESDRAYFEQITSKLSERFAARLGLGTPNT